MSLDIDVLLRAAARERENVDRLGQLLRSTLGYEKSRDASFRYEKTVEGNLIEVELLTDGRRSENGEVVVKVYGATTALDVCLADGADALADHVESIQITYLDGESKETAEIRIPDAVGFLLLKTTVSNFRQKPKDPYDIYYYCRHSEDPDIIRQKLLASREEQSVRSAIERLRQMFGDIDYQWVDMVLDHMNVTGSEREREAQFVVRAIHNITKDL